MATAPQGYLALILHAHLPFVRHPEYEQFLEENWLFEAITETYLPLLDVLDGLARDRVEYRLTLSLSPTLCAMLQDALLQERYLRHLTKLIELAGHEIDRTKWEGPFHQLAQFYHDRLRRFRDIYAGNRDLVGRFRYFQGTGQLEIITCAATHGFLPLLRVNPEAVRAQILVARDHYRQCFGADPRGIWLPECAYEPGLEEFLQEAGIRWFTLDTHGLLFAEPRPRYGVFAPVFTPTGVAAFGRDMESSRQVWSSVDGYPGDPDYRDFYRDIGFDAELNYIKPYIHPDGIRCFTGLKYHRITGPTRDKQPYIRDRAIAKAADHAGHFLFSRQRQVEHVRAVLQREPVIVAPYDAELFGHWWFEGPEFLDALIRKAAAQDILRLVTPTEYLRQFPTQQVAQPAASSWGDQGHWDVWLNDKNAWIYPHLHAAADRMTELVRQHNRPDVLTQRALRQASRELLLAQASDWAFIMKTGTTVPYAVKRTKDHLLRFHRLYEQIKSGKIDEPWLASLEWRDNLFPDLNPQYFA